MTPAAKQKNRPLLTMFYQNIMHLLDAEATRRSITKHPLASGTVAFLQGLLDWTDIDEDRVGDLSKVFNVLGPRHAICSMAYDTLGQQLKSNKTADVIKQLVERYDYRLQALRFPNLLDMEPEWCEIFEGTIARNMQVTLGGPRPSTAPPLRVSFQFDVHWERNELVMSSKMRTLVLPHEQRYDYDMTGFVVSDPSPVAITCDRCGRRGQHAAITGSRLFFDFQHGAVPMLELGAYAVLRITGVCCSACTTYFYEHAAKMIAHVMRDKKIYPHMWNRICGHCNAVQPTMKKCARCQLVSYCSRECQLADWRKGGKHKAFCRRHGHCSVSSTQ